MAHYSLSSLLILMCFFSEALEVTFCFEDIDLPPYAIDQDENNLAERGMLLHLIKLSAKKAGIEAKFIRNPWLRCQKLVRNNDAQSLFSMIQTDERSQLFAFPEQNNLEPYFLMQAEYALFVKVGGRFDLDDSKSLLVDAEGLNLTKYKIYSQFGLSAPFGYVAYEFLRKNKILTPVNLTPKQGFSLIINNKLDGYVIERRIGIEIAKSMQIEKLIKPSQFAVIKTYWHAPFNQVFYQQNKEQIDLFWSHFSGFREQMSTKEK
ncbi:hypothetical protein [Pseudoalteromonas denitrificans]|nr:hypothetical protein [Pseudoalteromonas denitrificans]